MPEYADSAAVLFDLDGTFADTAPDMTAALNRLLERRGHPPVPASHARPYVSAGTRGMLAIGFGLTPDDPPYAALHAEFLTLYSQNLCRDTCLFPGIAELVQALEARDLRWGIVTNKPAWLTNPLLEAMALDATPACVVSGDTAARAKPHPDPLLHACGMIERASAACWYIGDDQRDIIAGRAAGMRTLAALYGYLGIEHHPRDWGADGLLAHPMDALGFIDMASSGTARPTAA